MATFALLGAGRIGRMHADNLAANPRARLAFVYDVDDAAARETAGKHGVEVAASVEAALDGSVDAVLIASATNTHVELITAAARAGKAVFCEKPIDLGIERVNQCLEDIAGCDVPIQIGFNRRYDPSHLALREAVRAGEIGNIEQVIISSRDPEPPPAAYLEVCGGLYRDMMIHDFDLARFVLGEEPVLVSAIGSVLFDQNAGNLGDVDSAMVLMQTASGKLCHINCSRRAVYGYDQRLEVHGEKGMLLSNNHRPTSLERFGETATASRAPLYYFFIERYAQAYVDELNDFIDAVEQSREPSVTFEDGRRALILADAAVESRQSGRAVEVVF